jgi:beta-glucanase (GH16 family)
MGRQFFTGALILTALAAGNCRNGPADPVPPSPTPINGSAAWADEFDGPAGSAPDPRKWTYDLGNNNGWGNNELQTYTAETRNVHLDGEGHLVIRVKSAPGGFTSARLKTQGLLTAQYGRLEARIQMPSGRGLWPAFWMLGQTFNGSNWPQCGEIDVVEHLGREPSAVHAAVHGPGYSGGRSITASLTLPGGVGFADGYHIFAVERRRQQIVFSVDNVTFHSVTPASLPAGAAWVFDQPFFVLLNVAVGGGFPGPPDATLRLPQEMRVDYVRYTPSEGVQ